MATETDRIQKKVTLKAPLARVWRAISDAAELANWFGVRFEGAFVAGKPIKGSIVPTKADPEVAKSQEPYAGATFDITVDRIEPMSRFSFRWHPFAIDPKVDYSHEPTTLVVFELEEVPGGIHLTITESGFDGIPAGRRAKAFEMQTTTAGLRRPCSSASTWPMRPSGAARALQASALCSPPRWGTRPGCASCRGSAPPGRTIHRVKLTEGTEVTRQAVAKHLRVLEKGAGIVRGAATGGESVWEIEPSKLGTPVRRSIAILGRVGRGD